MLNRIYMIGGGLLIAAYVGWSFSGLELFASRMESVPTTRAFSSGGSRVGGGYYRSSGWGGGGYGK